jgi:hypothetical protein
MLGNPILQPMLHMYPFASQFLFPGLLVSFFLFVSYSLKKHSLPMSFETIRQKAPQWAKDGKTPDRSESDRTAAGLLATEFI